MRTYDRIQAAFPGNKIPAEVVVVADNVTSPQMQGAIRELRDRAVLTNGLLKNPITVDVSPDRKVANVHIPVAGDGSNGTSLRALAKLRDDVIPQSFGDVAVSNVYVGGVSAETQDFNDVMKSHVVLVFAFVLTAAFLLLMVTFRSIVIPIKAILLNLLSVAAAYGILVLVFQHGWFHSILGFKTPGSITAWLPLFLFVVLFGLSMDYHVFILSRIREAYDSGMSTEKAVMHGIKSTAGVVTSAAVVMVGVFGVFGTLTMIDFKEMGVGLAAAVLIDATIIRGVLLPASMKLLGDWNWYLPRRLGWLPRVSPEPEPVLHH
jgi:putative drug exporter of the RND superfamily